MPSYKAIMPTLFEEDEFDGDDSICDSSFAPETASVALSEPVEVSVPAKAKPRRGRPKLEDHERILPDKDRHKFSVQFRSCAHYSPGLAVMIPSGGSDRAARVTMSKNFDEILYIICNTIGCTDITWKLELSYTMKQVPHPGLQLDSLMDWGGFKEHIRSVFGWKDELVNVTILVSKEVSHWIPLVSSLYSQSLHSVFRCLTCPKEICSPSSIQ